MTDSSAKPRVLILGGVGFVGRHITALLVNSNLASHIRVVDKTPPATGWLNDKHKAVFGQVEFKQANLANAACAERVFQCEGEAGFDFVFNLAAETKYSQSDEVYRERVLAVAVNCARLAAKDNVKKFIHFSTAQVYDSHKGVSDEKSKVDPWTSIAKYHLKAEQEFKTIGGLNYAVLRPAIIYGPEDKGGLMPRLVTAACYRELVEPMKLLWSKDLLMNTVHVEDVAMAAWYVACLTEPSGEIYNLADKANTTQGLVTDLVSTLFEIESSYFGSVISNLAKLHMASAVEESNEKHLAPWSHACFRDGISNTPLSPYLDRELLYNRHLHVDGSKIERSGFSYATPRPTLQLLRQVVDDYVASGLFPPSLLAPPTS